LNDLFPHVIAHNIETVESLQRGVRDIRAGYAQSLQVLRRVKQLNPSIYTKSAIMVGLGETEEQVIQAMKDLRANGCDILTIGQYMKPREKTLAVKEYVPPDQFKRYEEMGKRLGFLYVASAPFVRSSYRAGELFMRGILEKGRLEKGSNDISSPTAYDSTADTIADTKVDTKVDTIADRTIEVMEHPA
jgi:lipoic acid synthetase